VSLRPCVLALINFPLHSSSHFLPWSAYASERLNVRNGLCLSRLHDAAFDQGLIAFDDNVRLRLSPRLKSELPARIVADTFGRYEGEALNLPDDAVPPELSFLSKHMRELFKSSC